jgi:hypothetical protein
MTTETVTGLYDTYADAARSVREIEEIGILRDDLSVIASNIDNGHAIAEESNVGPDPAIGSGVGVAFLAGLGLLALPGMGAVMAAGWLATAAAGAGTGGVARGVIGTLLGAGVGKEHANLYAEGIRRGGSLVTVRASDHQIASIEEIMTRNHAVDLRSRGRIYREAGWKSFDDSGDPYTESELAEERQRVRDLTPAP